MLTTNLHSQTSTPSSSLQEDFFDVLSSRRLWPLQRSRTQPPTQSHNARAWKRLRITSQTTKIREREHSARIESGCAGHFEGLGYQAPYPSKQLTIASSIRSIYAEPMTSLIFNQKQHQLSPSFLQTLVAHMACLLSLLPPLLFSPLHITIPSSELFPPHSPPPPNSKRP